MSFFKKIAKSVPTKGVTKASTALASTKKTISTFATKASAAVKKIDPKKAAAVVVVGGVGAAVAANSFDKDGKFDLGAGVKTTVSDATGIVKDSAGIVVSGAGDIASGAINEIGDVADNVLDTVGGVAGGALSGIFDFITPYLPFIVIIAAIIAFVYIRSIFR
jgi:hypothetical protein